MKEYSDFTKTYVKDICDYLNQRGIKLKNVMGESYEPSPESFETLQILIQDYLTKSLDLYTILNEQGLINRGYCPYTGERIDENFPSWSMMGKKIYLSHEGIKMLEKEDDENYEKVMGRKKPERTSSSGGDGCYIATVCYGGENIHQVVELKRFRDNSLSAYYLGKMFISFYYRVSPSIAEHLQDHPRINRFIRVFILNPIVRLVR